MEEIKIRSEKIEMVSIDTPIPCEETYWKKLEGTIYSVSRCGQFRNDTRGRVKKQTFTKDGYLTVNIHGKTKQSHRLVAKCWLDDYSESLVVNHIDFDRKNNNSYNLEMITVKDNARHSARANRYMKFGENNNNCKVSNNSILTIWTYLESGLCCVEITKKMKMSRRYVNDIKLGKIRNIWSL